MNISEMDQNQTDLQLGRDLLDRLEILSDRNLVLVLLVCAFDLVAHAQTERLEAVALLVFLPDHSRTTRRKYTCTSVRHMERSRVERYALRDADVGNLLLEFVVHDRQTDSLQRQNRLQIEPLQRSSLLNDNKMTYMYIYTP